MKNLINIAVVAITAASLVAVAQTPSTTTTTPTDSTVLTMPAATATPPATEVTPTAKKAKKAKTTKKAKPAAQVMPAAETTPATTTQASPAIETQGATTTAPAGTSTATVTVPAESKPWFAAIVMQASASNEDLKNVGAAEIETINFIGAGYKISATNKIGVRQYFSYKTTPNNANRVEQEVTAITFGTKTAGILGSDEIAPLFWYYMPTSQLTKALNTEEKINHDGTLRLDAEIAWTLNPKWTVSYYLNPRQSMVYKQSFINRKGETNTIEADTRLIHYGFVYYNVAETIQAYSSVGLDQRARTATLTSHSDNALLAVGANFVMGKLTLNPEVANTVGLKKNGGTVSAPRWLQTEDLEYQLTAALSF